MKELISLNQIEVLRGYLTDPVYSEHTNALDLSNLTEVLSKLTEKQYKYILHLLFMKRWITAKQVLGSVGLKNKAN